MKFSWTSIPEDVAVQPFCLVSASVLAMDGRCPATGTRAQESSSKPERFIEPDQLAQRCRQQKTRTVFRGAICCGELDQPPRFAMFCKRHALKKRRRLSHYLTARSKTVFRNGLHRPLACPDEALCAVRRAWQSHHYRESVRAADSSLPNGGRDHGNVHRPERTPVTIWRSCPSNCAM